MWLLIRNITGALAKKKKAQYLDIYNFKRFQDNSDMHMDF